MSHKTRRAAPQNIEPLQKRLSDTNAETWYRSKIPIAYRSKFGTAFQRTGIPSKKNELLSESQGQNLAVTVFCVPYLLNRGRSRVGPPQTCVVQLSK